MEIRTEDSKTGITTGSKEKALNIGLRHIDSKYRKDRHDNINTGGCGAFAKLLYYAVKKEFGIDPTIAVFMRHEDDRDINLDIIRTDYHPWDHIAIMIGPNSKYVIDSTGIHTVDFVEKKMRLPILNTEMTIKTLSKWVNTAHMWNPTFDRNEIPNIAKQLENVMKQLKAAEKIGEKSSEIKEMTKLKETIRSIVRETLDEAYKPSKPGKWEESMSVTEQQTTLNFGDNELQDIVDKFEKLPGLSDIKIKAKGGSIKTYKYGTGWLSFMYDKHDHVQLAYFPDEGVHDFVKHMEAKGFGPDIFGTLIKLGKKELSGYNIVVKFDKKANEESTTGGVPGYQTPKAFSKKGQTSNAAQETAKKQGFMKAPKTNNWFKPMNEGKTEVNTNTRLQEVGYKYKSNINSKWTTEREIENDLVAYMEEAFDANGPEAIKDIVESLYAAVRYGNKLLKLK
jgi:hypothetical protein